ncbi:MAG: cytochrome oxidase biogenesis protein Surf1, facilitates heme A insertion [Rhodobacterales bacterium 32-67-9]|nr:MAG: cytochrome oxidase biogenesis protein Surf1, facilitates heme A insertion [Rhodobacterales bacterium 32-67-9]
MRRYLSALILGAGGIAILVSLGVWQVRRLAWKEGIIAAIEAKIGDVPVTFESLGKPDPVRDQYLPVTVTGRIGQDYLRVLSGRQFIGSGFRIISPLDTGTGIVLIDRGFVAEDEGPPPLHDEVVTVTGNLLWPQDADSYTPPPDLGKNIWFARDVPAMAAALGTDPVLIVVRDGPNDTPITPVPVDTASIPNDHRNYAITWFSLAAVWAGMTGFLLWRIRQRTN